MAMADPHVTVGLPVYNDPVGLRLTVPSVLGQTWPGELRLLVVDDASVDETPDVLGSLRAFDDRIEVVRLPTSKGPGFVRNEILRLAGDGYLAWIDTGDLWHPRKLELQLAMLTAAEREDSDTPILCTCAVRLQDLSGERQSVKLPEIGGDQLLNALVGTLPAHLQSLIGPVALFRAAGGFDERLLRGHDYDFLVRFVGEGGRVISVSPDTPLVTHLMSDKDGFGADPASDRNLVEKHRPYYLRYGRAARREVISNLQRTIGFGLTDDGEPGRARTKKVRGRLTNVGGPDILSGSRSIGRLFRGAKAAVASAAIALRPGRRWLDRHRLIDFVRRVGLVRRITRSSSTGGVNEPLRSNGSAERKINDLEAMVTVGDVPTSTWLRLEELYRREGLLSSAQGTLDRALRQHPDDPDLLIRLVELLPLRRAWRDSVELWIGKGIASMPGVRAMTYARVALAYRELGQLAKAKSVAEEALRRWPRDDRVRRELYVCRSALVDWRRALVSADTGPPAPDKANPPGLVTELGFLAGRPGPISGRLFSSAVTPTVSLVLNGTCAATTSATPVGESQQSFSLNCQDIMPFLGDGDIITVEHEGSPLQVGRTGVRCEVSTGYSSRYAEFRKALEDGYIFTKFGALRKGYTPETKRQILILYDEVSEVLSNAYGYRTFPFYGNLLGAVRDHDFIPHDVGGFDMGYISRYRRPEEVRAEFFDVCYSLLRHGYFLRLEPWSVYVKRRYRDRVMVDVNYAWFNEVGELQFSFGSRYSPVTEGDRVRYPRKGVIAGHIVDIPGNSEDILSQIYGPSWAVADQGFGLDIGLKRDARYLLDINQMVSLEKLDCDRVDARIDEHPYFVEDPHNGSS